VKKGSMGKGGAKGKIRKPMIRNARISEKIEDKGFTKKGQGELEEGSQKGGDGSPM